ncbi:MAG: hypothetical protein LE178_03985, partial [Endomicrobium sp.]|nr:hypothetical protein [Endomicrobium sp.]
SACSPDKSSKAGSKGNNVNRNGMVSALEEKKNENPAPVVVDNRKWYKPTWATGPTGLGVGTVAGMMVKKHFGRKGDRIIGATSLLFGAGALPVMVAGETARAVTARFDLGPVAGAGIGVGATIGVALFTVASRILDGNFNGLSDSIKKGALLGAIFGGIAGLATGLESARWSKPDKSTTPKSTTKPDEDKQKQKEQKQGEQKKQESAVAVK